MYNTSEHKYTWRKNHNGPGEIWGISVRTSISSSVAVTHVAVYYNILLFKKLSILQKNKNKNKNKNQDQFEIYWSKSQKLLLIYTYAIYLSFTY